MYLFEGADSNTCDAQTTTASMEDNVFLALGVELASGVSSAEVESAGLSVRKFTGPVPSGVGCCCCCCFSHSAHWLPTRKKLLYTVANPARGLLNREKKKKKKSGSAPPPLPRALLVRRKNKKLEKNKKIRKSRGASTCLGATQAGVTQVVSVRLASVQGLLRLVS